MLAAVHDNDLLDDNQLECERRAYNAAFEELGLNWHWDPVTYACLSGMGAHALRTYIEREHAHLLRAYDTDFLVNAIEASRARCMARTQG